VTRLTRFAAALTLAASAGLPATAVAAADVDASPDASCARTLVCQVNAPIDAHGLLGAGDVLSILP